MNRPFGTLQPNLSAGERIKNVKARALYKATKKAFSRGVKQNKNSEIKVSPAGVLCNTRSNELRYLINRGYALCEDGICPCWFEGSNVTPQTENNLFTHFVSSYLPKTPAHPFPMLATKGVSGENTNYLTYGHIDVSGVDPSGTEDQYSGTMDKQYSIFPDPLGLYSPYNNTCRPGSGYDKTIFKHNWNQTMIRGANDIINDPTVAQGGSGINLSWSNNTKQNYLISYDPRNTKVHFNICPAKVVCDEPCCCQDVSFNWTGATGGGLTHASSGDSISHSDEYWMADVLSVVSETPGPTYEQTLRLRFPCTPNNYWTTGESYVINGEPTSATSAGATPIGDKSLCNCKTGLSLDCSGNITYPVCPC